MKDIIVKRFQFYKNIGDQTIKQLQDHDFHWVYNNESNSIAVIIKHLSGNMKSRWTNFLTEDGEKTWRKRDDEFIDDRLTKSELMDRWEKGWAILFHALEEINSWEALVYIRAEEHRVLDAVLRQLAHYSYHIGQMVYIAKMLKNEEWQTLSIPKNQSEEFNARIQHNEILDEQENASPVCYANSKEIRDDYK